MADPNLPTPPTQVALVRRVLRQRPKNRGAAPQRIGTRHQFIVIIAIPILQVIENLKGNAKMFSQLLERSIVGGGRPGKPNAAKHSNLERRGSLERVDFKRIQGGQSLIISITPEKFRPLTFTQTCVGVGKPRQDIG